MRDVARICYKYLTSMLAEKTNSPTITLAWLTTRPHFFTQPFNVAMGQDPLKADQSKKTASYQVLSWCMQTEARL